MRSAAEWLSTIDQSGAADALHLPRRHLQQYEDYREASPLGQTFRFAGEVFRHVDALVVLGDRDALMPTAVLVDALLDPMHNETSRGDRGGKPRVYFVDDRGDDDAVGSLLGRLDADRGAATLPQRQWGLVVIGDERDRAVGKVLIEAFESQGNAIESCYCNVEGTGGDRRSGFLSLATLTVAAALGIDTIQLLVGAMRVSDGLLGGDMSAMTSRVAGCLADGGRIDPPAAALDRWADWRDGLVGDVLLEGRRPVEVAVATPRMPRLFEVPGQVAKKTAAIELPVIDSLAMGVLMQAGLLGAVVGGGAGA